VIFLQLADFYYHLLFALKIDKLQANQRK